MAIKASGVSAICVQDVLGQKLRIPEYQRPYSWRPSTALQLVDDLQDAWARNQDAPYVLGALILHECRDERGDWLDVVDGQQRLLTLRMILATLQSEDLFSVLPANEDNETPVLLVWRALAHKLSGIEATEKASLRDFINTQCQLVRIVTDDVDEAFRVFDSQNYRGKPLAPHDLLKAYHLREMRGESAAMQAAVVETWESVRDEDLDRLFSAFLYRIARWSRGKSAPGFSIHDIALFKGISPQAHGGTLAPSQRYHLAAQAAMPLLTAWVAPGTPDSRDAQRSRFQLDAPLIAGRPFFEMVSFMLEELAVLEKEAKQSIERIGSFGPSHSRYRYVYELFAAALLYYTNKFGSKGLAQARSKLFAWAYALRVAMVRVQFVSADNWARGKDDAAGSPFVLLRNAVKEQAIQRLSVAVKPCRPEHEKELVAFIAKESTKEGAQ